MRESTDRTERLLTLLVLQSMKGTTMREKAIQLNLAGFSNVEIADLLDTSPQSVTQVLYEARKSSGKRKLVRRTGATAKPRSATKRTKRGR